MLIFIAYITETRTLLEIAKRQMHIKTLCKPTPDTDIITCITVSHDLSFDTP